MKLLRALVLVILFGWAGLLVLWFLRRVAAKQAEHGSATPSKAAALTVANSAPQTTAPAAVASTSSSGPVASVVNIAASIVDKGALAVASQVPGIGPVFKVADALVSKLPIPDVLKDFIRDPLTAQAKLIAKGVDAVVSAFSSDSPAKQYAVAEVRAQYAFRRDTFVVQTPYGPVAVGGYTGPDPVQLEDQKVRHRGG